MLTRASGIRWRRAESGKKFLLCNIGPYTSVQKVAKEGLMRRGLPQKLAVWFALLTCFGAAVARDREISPPARARIEKRVRHELLMLPYYSVFDNLAFRIDGRRVTLLGHVTRPTLRSDAERVVRGIESVEAVSNRIEVLPVSFHDDRLRRALYNAIYRHDALFRYGLGAQPSIHIIVKNGHVALEGVVANQMDRNIAGIQANSVSGVFSVTNRLRLERT
jgi:hyperosmotically inducible protein